VTVSLSALVSAANLSTTLFLDFFCLPGAAGTGLRQQTGTEDLPREAGIATWHDLCQPCVPARYLPALRPGTIFAGIASTDAPQCNASHRRWHHFPGCSSGHHFLGCTSQPHFPTKSASPPSEGSLVSSNCCFTCITSINQSWYNQESRYCLEFLQLLQGR